MVAPKNMTPQQIDWVTRMRASLETLHNQWYCRGDQHMDQELFRETDRKIRQACERHFIFPQDVAEAEMQNEGWDGELNGDLVVLGDALDELVKKFESMAKKPVSWPEQIAQSNGVKFQTWSTSGVQKYRITGKLENVRNWYKSFEGLYPPPTYMTGKTGEWTNADGTITAIYFYFGGD